MFRPVLTGSLLTALLCAALMAPVNAQTGGTTPPTLGLARTTTPPPKRPVQLRAFDTPYYTLYTDVSEAEARETDLRMTRMFEEYQRRTSGFAGKVTTKFPFYLFRHEADYYDAGAPAKSGGVYMTGKDGKKRLMALAGDQVDDNTWHTIQHEGFHQFIDAATKADLPIWVNEGLAEYFGEAQWTGDGFVTDLIPNSRLETHPPPGIQSGFKPFKEFIALDPKTWIGDLQESNYDQAWSMIHFLANADNGKYQGPFLDFMKQVAKGTEGTKAWEAVFGKDATAFQNRYAQWWLSLPDNPTTIGYLKVMMLTETSFLARARLQGQAFPDAETFFASYKPGGMTLTRDLWLPPSMFEDYRDLAMNSGGWELQNGKSPRLILTLKDGTVFTGGFTLANNKVSQVAVQDHPRPKNPPSR